MVGIARNGPISDFKNVINLVLYVAESRGSPDDPDHIRSKVTILNAILKAAHDNTGMTPLGPSMNWGRSTTCLEFESIADPQRH
jgi:hypothetical protein